MNPQIPPPPPSPLVQLAQAIEKAPRFFYTFLVTLIAASVSDIASAALAIGSVALGFAMASVWIGLAVFFFGFLVATLVNNVCAAIGSVGRAVQSSNPQPPPMMIPPQ